MCIIANLLSLLVYQGNMIDFHVDYWCHLVFVVVNNFVVIYM
jgi:hypothetical protein